MGAEIVFIRNRCPRDVTLIWPPGELTCLKATHNYKLFIVKILLCFVLLYRLALNFCFVVVLDLSCILILLNSYLDFDLSLPFCLQPSARILLPNRSSYLCHRAGRHGSRLWTSLRFWRQKTTPNSGSTRTRERSEFILNIVTASVK